MFSSQLQSYGEVLTRAVGFPIKDTIALDHFLGVFMSDAELLPT
jgi:hypothetical protein